MENILADKIVLVTGGTGSMGTEIVRNALSQGARKVIVFSRDEIKHFMLRRRIQDVRLETIIGDVRDFRNLESVFIGSNIDIIFHAAAMKHVVMCEDAPLQAVETNVTGTQNVTDLALKYHVPRVVTISTDKAAYPVNVLGATKLIAERITLNANHTSSPGQAFTCVRYGNVAISRGSVIPVFIDCLLHRKPIQVTDYEVTRFAMDISEAIRLVLEAAKNAKGGEVFILDMRAFRLGDVVDVIVERIAPKLDTPSKNVEIVVTGLLRGEKLDEDLVNGIEAQHLYRLGDMYVILEDDAAKAKYPGIKKVDLPAYTSRSVPFISKDELEKMILGYLKDYLMLGEHKYANGISP